MIKEEGVLKTWLQADSPNNDVFMDDLLGTYNSGWYQTRLWTLNMIIFIGSDCNIGQEPLAQSIQ